MDGDESSVGKNKISLILPNSITWFSGKFKKDKRFKNRHDSRLMLYSTEFRTHDKFAKRVYYAFKPVWFLIHFWDTLFANNFEPTWNLGFDTLTVYPAAGATSPVDGRVGRDGVDEAFSTIIGGAGNSSDALSASQWFMYLGASSTTNQFIRNWRSIFLFDTSGLTSAAIISAATLSLEGNAKLNEHGGSPTFEVVASTPAANDNLANADYGQLGAVSFSSMAYASFSIAGYNDFSLNASGIANISKTGISKFGCKNGWDLAGSFGGTWGATNVLSFTGYFADQTGTTSDPKLVVTYTLPGEDEGIFSKDPASLQQLNFHRTHKVVGY